MSDPFLAALDARAGPPAIRNNNPGNIVFDPRNQWQGQVGNDGKFAVFDTPENGDRAHAKLLSNYAQLHGVNTIRGAISRFAPPSDGNNTDAYASKVSQQLGVSPDAPVDLTDPRVNAAVRGAQQPIESGVPTQPGPQSNDPFLKALDAATQSPNGSGASSLPDNAGNPAGEDSGSIPPSNPDPMAGAAQQPSANGGGALGAYDPGRAAADAPMLFGLSPNQLRNLGVGSAEGLNTVFHTAGLGMDWAANKLGLDLPKVDEAANAKWVNAIRNLAQDPNSTSYSLGKIGGEIAATLPITEIRALGAIPGLGKWGSALARYGDLALQGGAIGALSSDGKNVGQSTAFGAAAAPLAGAAISKFGPGIKAFLERNAVPEAASATEAALPPLAEGASIRAGSELPKEGVYTDPKTGASGLHVNITGAKITPEQISSAMGTNGARSGIEATNELPEAVSAKVQELTGKGVPVDQAIREADILNAGGKPTIANVTRDPTEQSAMWEGAKEPTPEGRALSQQISSNNAAVLAKLQGMVQSYGGVPAQGEAAETAARSLASASDTARAKVGDLYKIARLSDGEQTVSVDALRELLSTPEFKAPTDASSRELVTGMRRLTQQMSQQNGNRFTPDQVEQLRQAANSAYDRMGGSVNDKVGRIKSALDDSLDQLEKAGPAYKTARQAHKDWAAAYDNPEGISKLIRRDAQGNFLNEDNWRAAEGIVGTAGDKQFIQIVKQLRANGDTASINRLKSTILQRAYERGTNGAKDQLDNATLSAKAFFTELNKVGLPKLKAIFTPKELAEIASTGRAATHLNEAVPGTNNTSNTASALGKALGLAKKPHSSSLVGRSAKAVAHVALGPLTHGASGIALEGADHIAGTLRANAAKKALAQELMRSMDPEAARVAAKAEAKRMADTIRRRADARNASTRSAPVAAALQERRQ